MKALVVVESVFGNTRTIAEAVARGLSRSCDVEVVTTGDAPNKLPGVDLLVAGGPTHAFGMSSPQSRRAAAEQSGATVTDADKGLREWLAELAIGNGHACATFDTRSVPAWMPGSAAAKAARVLGRKEYRTIDRPRSFRVSGTRGPLADGEADRAEHWGADLAGRCATLPWRSDR